MKAEYRAIAKQLIKEFWIQFVLSINWSIYNILIASEEDNLFSVFLKNFGTSFFLLSWFFGQFNRVKKQKKTDGSFDDLKTKTESLIKQLDEATIKTISHVTGGDSFPIVKITGYILIEDEFRFPTLSLSVSGNYPLYDLNYNINIFDQYDYTNILGSKSEQIDSIHKNGLYSISLFDNIFKDSGDTILAEIKVKARNGFFRIDLKIIYLNGDWIMAYQVIKNRVVIYLSIDERFPIGNNIFEFSELMNQGKNKIV
jgi:hypothetical protein